MPTGASGCRTPPGFDRQESIACGQALAEFAPRSGLLGSNLFSGELVDPDVNGSGSTDTDGSDPQTPDSSSRGGPGFGVLSAFVAVFVLAVGSLARRSR